MATIEHYQSTACIRECGKRHKTEKGTKPPPWCSKEDHSPYRVRYRKPDGKQTDKRGFRRKRDAEIFAATVEVDKLTGNYIAPSLGRMTVGELHPKWYERQVFDKESWSTRVESILRCHIEPYWGGRAVASIDSTEVQEWVAKMDRAASTVADIHSVFAAVLDDAVAQKRIPANPARGVKIPKRPGADHNYLTHVQVAQLAAASKHPEIVFFLAYSGCRWGEMAALRPRDVNLDRHRIYITRSASKVNSRSVIGTPKTWEVRTVAVPAEVAELLRPIVEAQRDPSGLLWSRPDGEPLRPPTTTHWFGAAVRRCIEASTPRDEDGEPSGPATFPRVTVHQLRHTSASLMISSGANVKTVQRQLGHKSAVMTLDNYGHLFEDDLDGVADRMSARLRAAAAWCGQNVGRGGGQASGVA